MEWLTIFLYSDISHSVIAENHHVLKSLTLFHALNIIMKNKTSIFDSVEGGNLVRQFSMEIKTFKAKGEKKLQKNHIAIYKQN